MKAKKPMTGAQRAIVGNMNGGTNTARNLASAVASTAGATHEERSANFRALSVELQKAKKPMTGAQRRIVSLSKGGHPRGPNKKKRSDAGTTGIRKKRAKEGKKRKPYNTKKKKELLAAQARANNNKISDAFKKAKLAKKKGH